MRSVVRLAAIVAAALGGAVLGWAVVAAVARWHGLVAAYLVATFVWSVRTDARLLYLVTPVAVFLLVDGPTVWRWWRGRRDRADRADDL